MNKMMKKKFKVGSILLIVLGIAMIYFGGFHAPKLMLPPIITGVGFFVIAWVFCGSSSCNCDKDKCCNQ